ncbi:MAG: A/G-specific adenine glycosylase [Phycisphaerae bacterium]
MTTDQSANTALIRRRLPAWYRKHGRDLPWRRSSDPYRVWLSELMLQQTQVATVIPYYERFLRRFPDIRRLAAARLESVLRLWSGLGYYARARNLHAAAKRIVAEYDGRFPETVQELRTLPGIGRYTAAAIASICFNRRAAVVDGNVARVLARLFIIREPINTAAALTRLQNLADALIPARRCGDFNQAMMELGARVCTPRNPQCRLCPIRSACGADQSGVVDELPVRKAAAPNRTMRFVVLAVERDGRWLFERRETSGLWGGLWQLPAVELVDGRSSWSLARQIAAAHFSTAPRLTRRPTTRVQWKLTHRDVEFLVHCAECNGAMVDRGAVSRRVRWMRPRNLHGAPVSTAMRRVVDAVARAVASAARSSR